VRHALALALVGALLAGCAPTRQVVPVAAAGIAVELGQSAVASPDGVQLFVRPSAWQGSPAYLPGYVTPFHLLVVNGSPLPLAYDYGDLRLFDEGRFQYTAMPPADVGRILRWSDAPSPGVVVAAAGTSASLRRGRRPVFGHPFWWDPWWWGPPYYAPPRLDDVLTQALPVGILHAGARTQGFAYFPRLRPEATRLIFEFHHRLGDAPRVLTLPFAVQRAADRPGRLDAG
jgi:hypothetical protein